MKERKEPRSTRNEIVRERKYRKRKERRKKRNNQMKRKNKRQRKIKRTEGNLKVGCN
jgi:hypothetical protein